MFTRASVIFVVPLFVLPIFSSDIHALVEHRDIDAKIAKQGYELTEDGMREALSNRDESVIFECLLYIEREKLSTLVSEVREYIEYVERENLYDSGTRLTFVRCLLATDQGITDENLQTQLKQIRKVLFESGVPGDEGYIYPIHAYFALLAAEEYHGTDIYDDLLFLSCTNIIKGSADYPSHTKKLFDLYGDRVTDSDLDTMLAAWEDQPNRQQFILRRAREHGLRIQDSSASPERAQASLAAE